MNDAGPNPLAVFVLSAAARELLADGVDPGVVEEVLACVRVDVVPRGAYVGISHFRRKFSESHFLKNQVALSTC